MVNTVSLMGLYVCAAGAITHQPSHNFHLQKQYLAGSQKNLSFVAKRSQIMASLLKNATAHIPD